MSNHDELKPNWHNLKGRVRVMWGRLTSHQVEAIDGHRDQLEGALRRAYNWSPKQIRREVDEFCRSRGFGIDRAAAF